MEKAIKKNRKLHKIGAFDVFNATWMILFSLYCLIPICIMLSASFSNDRTLAEYGYTLFPKKVTLDAYKFVFESGKLLMRAYLNSIIVTGAGTILNLLTSAMIAFPLSKYDFAYKKLITPLLLVTMLFSPGLVPTYILITQFLHWKDTMWVLIIPQIGTTFNIILLRTFFSDIPREIGESAKIDGCSVFREFLTITLPLSMPALATCSVLMALSYWNDWGTPFLYIGQFNTDLYTVQYLMAKLEMQAKSWYQSAGLSGDDQNINSVIMATCIIGTMPIMFVFLYLQKYIVKGMTVGAVKG